MVEMTLEQKIGQMLMIGWQTDSADDIVESIKKYNFGNIILFTRNIKSTEQISEVILRIQEAAIKYNGVPCLISIDQEGGSVRRIYNGVTSVCGNMAIAAASSKYPDAAALCGKIIAQDLKKLGINFDLAPVVDINSNPNNPVIAIRSYGDSPLAVSRLASDFAVSMQKQGVLSCYKHFLGHGDVDVDSHLELPRLKKTAEEVEMCELVPYKSGNRADSVMSVHVLYSAFDDHFPASLSSTILKGILRERLKFDGLIVTDCFEMDALLKTFSLEEAACFAVNATTDIITVSHTLGRQLLVRNALIKAVKEGTISSNVIDSAIARINRIKAKYCTDSEKYVVDEKNNEYARKISEASVTLVSGQPFEIDKDTVVIGVTNYVNSIAEDTNVENMDIAKLIGEEYNISFRSIDNKNFNLNDTLNFTKGKKVVLCLSDGHLTLVQKALYNSLVHSDAPVMLISLRTPYIVLGQDLPYCHICTFEYTSMACSSLIKALKSGKYNGTCPVKLDKLTGQFTSADGGNYIVENVMTYIRLNFAQKLTLESVANEFYISGGYLCRLLKNKVSKNFIDLLNEIRVGESKRLLTTTPMRVYEIATLCGFSDFDYFTKVFRKYTGSTPSYFRNNFQIND